MNLRKMSQPSDIKGNTALILNRIVSRARTLAGRSLNHRVNRAAIRLNHFVSIGRDRLNLNHKMIFADFAACLAATLDRPRPALRVRALGAA
ncbi:MAG: hypothetical protein R3D02_13675 [Hyphomicrobiales bacterium]